MTHSLSQENLLIKHAGLAVECGALDTFLAFVTLQPVLLMPITRTVQHGNATMVRQWAVHLTARANTTSPVYYATFRAAEVIQDTRGRRLTAPYGHPQRAGEDVVHQATKLQESLVTCVHQMLDSQTPGSAMSCSLLAIVCPMSGSGQRNVTIHG